MGEAGKIVEEVCVENAKLENHAQRHLVLGYDRSD
jgi:hypothetical protein